MTDRVIETGTIMTGGQLGQHLASNYTYYMSHVMGIGKCALKSLSLAYQKKDWQVGPHKVFFWYDTD